MADTRWTRDERQSAALFHTARIPASGLGQPDHARRNTGEGQTALVILACPMPGRGRWRVIGLDSAAWLHFAPPRHGGRG